MVWGHVELTDKEKGALDELLNLGYTMKDLVLKGGCGNFEYKFTYCELLNKYIEVKKLVEKHGLEKVFQEAKNRSNRKHNRYLFFRETLNICAADQQGEFPYGWNPAVQQLRNNRFENTRRGIAPMNPGISQYSSQEQLLLLTEVYLINEKHFPVIEKYCETILDRVRTNANAYKVAKSLFKQNYIYKLHYDCAGHWGDGGGASFVYPVYICDKLNLEQGVQTRLCNVFRKIHKHQLDVQPNNVVCDIIDPSLNSNLLDEPIGRSLESEEEDSEEEDMDAEEQEEINLLSKPMEEANETRGSFQWVPTEVECTIDQNTGNCNAKFLGPIAGLPDRRFCPQVYQDMEILFSKMLPMFGALLSKEDFSQKLQVVFKVQEYIVPPKSKYTGRWHTEGFSENIKQAGVFYLDVSDETKGGELLFQPRVAPGRGYTAWCGVSDMALLGNAPFSFSEKYFLFPTKDTNIPVFNESEFDEENFKDRNPFGDRRINSGLEGFEYSKQVAIQTGTAVVFDNEIPHRFRTIDNEGDQPIHRLFINFFIVDTKKPLQCTTSNAPSRSLLLKSLHPIDSRDLQEKILDYIGGYGTASKVHHAVVRDKAREAMSKARANFQQEFYGNNGDLEYYEVHPRITRRYYEGVIVKEHSNCPSSQLGSGL